MSYDISRKHKKASQNSGQSWRKFDIAKKISSTKCEENRDCKACWQKYIEEELMSYICIGMKEQSQCLIDELPDDQHKLGKCIEIGENYNMSQLTAQAFKTLNTNAAANSIDVIKHTKEKVNYAHIMVYGHKCGYCPAKEAKCKICQKIGHYAKVCRSQYRKEKQNSDRSNTQTAKFTGCKKTNNVHLMADDSEILGTTPKRTYHGYIVYMKNLTIPLHTVPRDI